MAEIQYLSPVLQVTDLEAAETFFAKIGFQRSFAWGEPVRYIVMSWGNSVLHLNLVESATPKATGLYVQVDNADELWEALKEDNVMLPITDQPYGMREFTLWGPEEISVTIGHELGH